MSDDEFSFGNAVLKYCKEGKTGTILLSTNNNKACQVILTRGHIVAVTMGRIKGLEAVLAAKKIGVKAESFNERQLRYTDESKINSSDEIMKLIGSSTTSKYNEVIDFLNTDALDGGAPLTSNIVAEKSSSSPMKKLVRMYRGQALDE